MSLGSLSSPMGLLPSPFIRLAACLLLARKPTKKTVQSTQENGQVTEGSVAAQESKAQGTGGHEKQPSPAPHPCRWWESLKTHPLMPGPLCPQGVTGQGAHWKVT